MVRIPEFCDVHSVIPLLPEGLACIGIERKPSYKRGVLHGLGCVWHLVEGLARAVYPVMTIGQADHY